MTKFINKFKKPTFGPFSEISGRKIIPKNLTLTRTFSYRFLSPCLNTDKNDPIPRKCPDKQTEKMVRRRDGCAVGHISTLY